MKVHKVRVSPKDVIEVWYDTHVKTWYGNIRSERTGTLLLRECVNSCSLEDCLVWTAITYVKRGF